MTPGGDGRAAPALVGIALCIVLAAGSASAQCVGDCDGNDMVAINELVLGVNISLGILQVGACPAFDCQNDGTVPVNCLVQGVNNSLNGCGEPCPLAAGTYTITQVEGGTLTVGSLSPFPFPAGGTLVEDVSSASQPDCVHSAVLPFPGGFSAPIFCIPSFGFSVTLSQTGCGIGEIDSNGGSDYTITELGDTSSQPECDNQQACTNGVDSKVRVDISVGDGTADTCSGGSANAIASVPVNTVAWVEVNSGASCPANDGMFNPDQGDTLILDVNQILDFTTDSNRAQWMDLSGDGCPIAGVGPASGLSNSGECLDLAGNTVGIAASGAVGSNSGPLFDFTFTARLLNSISGPNPPQSATCDDPPVIDFTGTAIRCLE